MILSMLMAYTFLQLNKRYGLDVLIHICNSLNGYSFDLRQKITQRATEIV